MSSASSWLGDFQGEGNFDVSDFSVINWPLDRQFVARVADNFAGNTPRCKTPSLSHSRRTSLRYHTDRPRKLTISRSRDMVGSHQNLTGLRDLTTPLLEMLCHPRASTCYRQLTHQIWSLYLHSLRRYERRYKMSKMGWFGGDTNQSRWLEIAPFDRAHTCRLCPSIVTMSISCTVSEKQQDIGRKPLI